ncbi:hypothetical protein ATANTOWER_009988, partial [Ataeniobius toweri]|nr:hypothetical protein [Ataeniobius toweri]
MVSASQGVGGSISLSSCHLRPAPLCAQAASAIGDKRALTRHTAALRTRCLWLNGGALGAPVARQMQKREQSFDGCISTCHNRCLDALTEWSQRHKT